MAADSSPVLTEAFLLENISDACYALDAQWRITLLNSKAEGLLGSTRQELLGQVVWERFPEAEVLGLKQKYEQALATGETVSFGMYYPNDSRWYVIRAVPAPPGVLVFFHNDDERAEGEHLYRALVENALDGITLLDADLNPFYRSPANATIMGYPRDSAGPFLPTPHQPVDFEPARERLESLKPGESFTHEFRTERPDGDGRWIQGTFTNRLHEPAIRAIIFNFQDITERKRLQEETERRQDALEEANRQLQVRIGRLSTLHRVHLAASSTQELDGIVGNILSSALQGSQAAGFVFVAGSDEPECIASYGPQQLADALPVESVRAIARRAIQEDAILIADASEGTAGNPELQLAAELDYRGQHAVPFNAGSTRGAFVLLTKDQMFADDESQSYITTLTGYIAGALDTVRLLESLKRQAHDYRELARFGQTIETITDINDLVTHGLGELLAQLRVDYATLAAVEGNHAFPRWRSGAAADDITELLSRPIPLGRGAVAEAVSSGRSVLVQDYLTFEDRPEYLKQLGFTSVLALPIDTIAGGQFVFILASTEAGRQIDDTAVSIAELFAKRIANAFERVEYLDEVKSTREATFRALGLALEYRDYETKGHTDRVVRLAEHFGAELGFGSERLQALRWGAYLHDLGKLSVPDQVLLKPGRLTDAEFELIKRHPVTGAELCRDIPFLPEATRQVVRHHHEKWDGTGYPDQLAGKEIPLEARLFALVDVYDALTSDRPYRPAWSHDETLAYLQEQSGIQFDPELLTSFLAVVLSADPE